MIKFVVARYENDGYDSFLNQCGKEQNTVHIFNEEADSIFQKYNIGIQKHIDAGLDDNDILVFCHADVKILDESFEEKLEYAFQNIPKLGVAGVIGSTILTETAGWWLSEQTYHKGHVVQWIDNEENNKYHMIREVTNNIDMTVVDGLILFVRGSLAKSIKFDEQTYPGSYNFYDYDYCLHALEVGYRIGVLDILTEHKSNGSGIYKEDWIKNKDTFLNKWKSKGYTFPLATKPRN
jgi:hypothetical protein